MSYPTPLLPCPGFTPGVSLFIKREDLLPFSFGGNKVRIAEEYYAEMERQGKNCMVGYGNPRSNLCRVLAAMGSARGYACHIISPADEDGSRPLTANALLAAACGAIYHPCRKEEVAGTVSAVLAKRREEGLSPYYIYGDIYGQGNREVPVRAYVKAYQELAQQCSSSGPFDWIFCATGTGMTQAGLLAGQLLFGGSERIVGISVARDATRATAEVSHYLEAYCAAEGLLTTRTPEILVTDDYLCGGYGKYDDAILSTILRLYQRAGITTDPTYTGKAFYGMLRYLSERHITSGRVLFLHTGGTPLFFDQLPAWQTSLLP